MSLSGADRTGELVTGKYKLNSLLGTGGMGAVYSAIHTGIGKKVAVKFLHRELCANADLVQRFLREARAAAAIGHKNIIDVHDIGTADDGSPFLVMELLVGESLRSVVDRGKSVAIDFAVGVVLPVLSALAAAHRKGIVHRDLKPDNIFIERTTVGRPSVKLLDFGIAKMTEGGLAQATRTGITMGTPGYMAPEQARGETQIDRRVDVYAMGVILYELLTGRLPHVADNYNALMVKILSEAPAPPGRHRADLPEALEAIIVRAMQKDRNDRYTRVEDLLEAILPFSEPSDRALDWDAVPAEVAPDASSAPQAPPQPETRSAGHTAVSAPRERIRPRALIATGASALALLVAFGSWRVWNASAGTSPPSTVRPGGATSSATNDPTASPTPPQAPAAVTITFTGIPDGARILFDGAEVTDLPLRVPKRDFMVPLRVEAGGYEPFSQMILPTHDQTVDIALRTMPPMAGSSREAVRHRARNSEQPAPSPPPAAVPVRDSPSGQRLRSAPIQTDTSEFD